jgi:hypothetical protein
MRPTWYHLFEGVDGVRLVGWERQSLRAIVLAWRRASHDGDPHAKLRRISRGAYEYTSQRTRERGERRYFFTLTGIDALRRPGAQRRELLPGGVKWGRSPLRKELRARWHHGAGSRLGSAS